MSLLLGLLEKPQAEVKGEDQILPILAPEKLRVSSPELKGVVVTIPLLGMGGDINSIYHSPLGPNDKLEVSPPKFSLRTP